MKSGLCEIQITPPLPCCTKTTLKQLKNQGIRATGNGLRGGRSAIRTVLGMNLPAAQGAGSLWSLGPVCDRGETKTLDFKASFEVPLR